MAMPRDTERTWMRGPRTRFSLLLAGVLATAAVLASPAYSADGDLDPTFGVNGSAITDLGALELAEAMGVQPDGRIVLAGTRLMTESRARGAFGLARYLPDGSLDATFSDDGIATLSPSDSNFVTALAVQADGRIVLAGDSATFTPFSEASLLLRLDADGSPDTTFSGDGRLTSSFAIAQVAVAPDGRIVTAGSLNGDFAIARYHADGSPDVDFGAGGLQTIDIGTADDHAQSLSIDPGGAIVAAGYSRGRARDGLDGAVARLHADGSPDLGFSDDGARSIGSPGVNEVFGDVVVQGDGSILAGGQWGIGSFLLARVGVDGSLDSSFAQGGIGVTDVSASSDGIRSLALSADGRIFASGGDGDFTLARYNPDGTLDTSFSGDGIQKTPVSDGFDVAVGVALQPGGCKVVLGGEASGDFALARYRSGCPADVTPPGSAQGRTSAIASLFGSRSRRLGRFISVFASCREAPCRVVASGSVRVPRTGRGSVSTTFTFKAVARTIARKGIRAKLSLRLRKAVRSQIRNALRRGLRVTVKLRVSFRQPNAKTTILRRNVRLRL